MHNQYAKDGLVCMSVSVDDKGDRDKALAFLKAQKADFPNYWIDEEAEVWQTKLEVPAPPGVIVFGRDGQRVKTFTSEDPYSYEDVEKLIKPLLAVQK
jgi:hypothetical protein